jgi:hypothetical protein
MASNTTISYHKSHIRKLTWLKQSEQFFWQARLWYLNSYVQHPNVVKAKFAVVSSENIQLTFNYVSCVSASRSWSIVTCLDFLPVISVNIEDMYIVHPVNTVVATKIVNFRIN